MSAFVVHYRNAQDREVVSSPEPSLGAALDTARVLEEQRFTILAVTGPDAVLYWDEIRALAAMEFIPPAS